MATKYCQISLKDTFSDCKSMFIDDVSLFIPQTFYQFLGCKRDCPLIGFLFTPHPAENLLHCHCFSADYPFNSLKKAS